MTKINYFDFCCQLLFKNDKNYYQILKNIKLRFLKDGATSFEFYTDMQPCDYKMLQIKINPIV
jgi:hypothetical protein